MCNILGCIYSTKKIKIFKRTKPAVLAEETNGFAVLTRTLIKNNVYV